MSTMTGTIYLSIPRPLPPVAYFWVSSSLFLLGAQRGLGLSPVSANTSSDNIPPAMHKRSEETGLNTPIPGMVNNRNVHMTAPYATAALSTELERIFTGNQQRFSAPVTLTTGENVKQFSVDSGYTTVNRHDASVTDLNNENQLNSGETTILQGSDYARTAEVVTKSTDANNEQFQEADVKFNARNCSVEKNINIVYAKKGRITGLLGGYSNLSAGPDKCHWAIHLPDGFSYLYVLLTLPQDPCYGWYRILTYNWEDYVSGDIPQNHAWINLCNELYRQFFVKSRRLYFILSYVNSRMAQINPQFIVEFDSYTEDIRKRLHVITDTPSSGSITQWGYDGTKNYFCINDAYHELQVPNDYVVMVSFPRFDMHAWWNDCPDAGIQIYSFYTHIRLAHYCGGKVIDAQVYPISLRVHFKTQLYCNFVQTGFKALYSLILKSEGPEKSSNSLYNCSTPTFEHFRHHLACNMEHECYGYEDEGGHCPYSSARCKGTVSSGHKCYHYVNWDQHISSFAAQKECAKNYGDLAMLKSPSEWNDLKKIFQYGKRYGPALFGVRSGDSSFPDMYRFMLKWVDNSVAQNMHALTTEPLTTAYHFNYEMCGILRFRQKFDISFERCTSDGYTSFICQVIAEQPPVTNVLFAVIDFPFSDTNRTKPWMLPCLDGHVTHAFLSCDPHSHCHTDKKHVQECKLPRPGGNGDSFVVAMFVCDDTTTTVPYTLVCDFRQDCSDASDEEFCVHDGTCLGFRCHSGQCVDKDKRCNLDRDCLDESDEQMCEDEVHPFKTRFVIPQVVRLPPPVSIDFNMHGDFSQVALEASATCQSTHFRCVEHYCLPVYLRCNGVKDCPGGEDEWQCPLQICQGFYHCQSSMVCVHATHLCDGWPQCPQHDDEWLCDITCPEGCLCQGHAFVCPQSVSLTPFPLLRYLDANGSGMGPHNVTDLFYLIWLSLSQCNLQEVLKMNLTNLRTLDLSHNQLMSIHMDVFLSLVNLKVLSLSRNLLTHFYLGDSQIKQTVLHTLDLSWNVLGTFSTKQISRFSEIHSLNISNSKVHTFPQGAFSSTLTLQQIDFRGNPFTSSPRALLKSLVSLQSLWTDDYRLCCQQNLPDQFYSNGQCISSQIHLSSCKDLLRYEEHRIALFVMMLLCMAGNVGCLMIKCCMRKTAVFSPTDLQMAHWSLMDLLMGVYISIIVTADWIYRHRYFSVQHTWTTSITCKTAGFLVSVSYQATAFLVCLVTLHGLCTASSHRVRVQVTRRCTLLVCALIWTVAVVISVVPLLTPEWKFYGHTDTCLVLLTTVSEGSGRIYAFSVLVALHVAVCFLVSAGQGVLYWLHYFQDDATISITQRFLQMADATSASPQVLLDSARRLMFCVISVLAHSGVQLPEHTYLAFAVLVLPVSVALNPLLFIVNMLTARRRHRTHQRVLQRLQRQLIHGKHP